MAGLQGAAGLGNNLEVSGWVSHSPSSAKSRGKALLQSFKSRDAPLLLLLLHKSFGVYSVYLQHHVLLKYTLT